MDMLNFLMEHDVILKSHSTGNCMTADEAYEYGGEFVVYDNTKAQNDLYRGGDFEEAVRVLEGKSEPAPAAKEGEELTRLRTERDELRAALQPFAQLAEWFPPRVTDSTLSIYETPDGHIFTVGDFRKAARLLADEQPADAGEGGGRDGSSKNV